MAGPGNQNFGKVLAAAANSRIELNLCGDDTLDDDAGWLEPEAKPQPDLRPAVISPAARADDGKQEAQLAALAGGNAVPGKAVLAAKEPQQTQPLVPAPQSIPPQQKTTPFEELTAEMAVVPEPAPAAKDRKSSRSCACSCRPDVDCLSLLLPALCVSAVLVPVVWDSVGVTWALIKQFRAMGSASVILGFTVSAVLSVFPFTSFWSWSGALMVGSAWRTAVLALVLGRLAGLTCAFFIARIAVRLGAGRKLPLRDEASLSSRLVKFKASRFYYRVATLASSIGTVIHEWPMCSLVLTDFTHPLSSILAMIMGGACGGMRWYTFVLGISFSNLRIICHLFGHWFQIWDSSSDFPTRYMMSVMGVAVTLLWFGIVLSTSMHRCAHRLEQNATEADRGHVRANERKIRQRLCGAATCGSGLICIMLVALTLKSLGLTRKLKFTHVEDVRCLHIFNSAQNLTLYNYSIVKRFEVNNNMPMENFQLEGDGLLYNAETQELIGSMSIPRIELAAPDSAGPQLMRTSGGGATSYVNMSIDVTNFAAVGWFDCFLPDGNTCPDQPNAAGDSSSTGDNATCTPVVDQSYLQCLSDRCEDADLVTFGAPASCPVIVGALGCDYVIGADAVDYAGLQGQPIWVLCLASCSRCRRLDVGRDSAASRSLQGMQSLSLVMEIDMQTTGVFALAGRPAITFNSSRGRTMRQSLEVSAAALFQQAFNSTTMGAQSFCQATVPEEEEEEEAIQYCADSSEHLWNFTEDVADNPNVYECSMIGGGHGGSFFSVFVLWAFLLQLIVVALSCHCFGCFRLCTDNDNSGIKQDGAPAENFWFPDDVM